jgi:hypothetical protein
MRPADREPDEPGLLEALEAKTQAGTKPKAPKRGEVDPTVSALESEKATVDGARKAPKRVVSKMTAARLVARNKKMLGRVNRR